MTGDVLWSWEDIDFTVPESGVWPTELLEREQWMGHVGKKPFAPWGERDAPAPCTRDDHDAGTAAECDCDARWKWGFTENYVDGETVALAEAGHRLDGRAFLQQPSDPYAYVDGDDVRDPETGSVHPAFVAILEHLGLTYADVSQSGAGVHAMYRGELPEGVKQASWQLDTEPWGANDDLPSIEIYPGKRVCVATGEHVPGTPTEIREWNADVLGALLEANDEVAARQREAVSTARDDYDLGDYEPSAMTSTETTDDIRDLFAALDRIDARTVAERTIVHRWNDTASTSDGKRAFSPTWGRNANGTANIVDRRIWQDTGDEAGYGGPVVMALIDAREMSHRNASPRAASGQTWWKGVEHLRALGFGIPEYEPSDEGENDGTPRTVSSLPLGQLEHLPHGDRKRAAKKRGLEWPSTRDARDRLFGTLTQVMRHGDTAVVDAPTSLGKSHTVATTPWNADATLDDVTGGAPVIHLQATRDARDEAIEAAEGAGLDWFALKSRHEACPVAGGDHDPHPEEDGRDVITVSGTPASEWLEDRCDDQGLPFSAAHRYLETHNDQGADLPCCHGDSECPAIAQWETWRDRRSDLDVVFATHNFAHVPGLRMGTNLILDEEPDFVQDLTKERVEKAVTAYLQAIDAPVKTWETFVGLAQHDGWGGDAGKEREALRNALDSEPQREAYFEDERLHTLAPALARAIFHAEERPNGRRVGKTPHEPPRLDASAVDEEGWNREWVSVVMTEENGLQTVRAAPDFSQARSVVGLDAHPARPRWMVNVHPAIQIKQVLDPAERRLWRRYERGLHVVQVGDATRPLASGEYYNDRQVRGLADHLVDEYGHRFRTAITAKSVEEDVAAAMEAAGAVEPETMHYGEEKSRNDFANEQVGLVNGCIDPGDDFVLDLLAELDLDAEPERSESGDRAHGRGFVGDDAETAKEILASVRENHTAQAAGRYARSPDDPDSHATVFVRTDAMPTGFADIQTSGVVWTFSDLQEEIVETLREAPQPLSARDIADEVGCSKRNVQKTLKKLAGSGGEFQSPLQSFESAGAHGATLYADSGLPNSGVVDVDIANSSVWESYTWSFAIRDALPGDAASSAPAPGRERPAAEWALAKGGDPPPDDPK